ncbi:JHBP domain containing protein [Asbolus verrucosus]|uniref:JHBP domain containing protein n=1 Tax=Asbolus verrucosus TaxID=1661398 RepID=A0A482W9C2_ASBVE|nr:JHBP domain containing protein [Asbolus verrucosus]
MNRSVAFFLLLALSDSAKIPPNFKKCNRKQPDLKECVLGAVRDGAPQLAKPFREVGLPSVEPLEVAQVTIKAGSGAVAVDQNFKNCKIYGLSGMQLDKFEFNFDAKALEVVGVFPEVDVRCEYKLDGKVFSCRSKAKDPLLSKFVKNNKIDAVLGYEEVAKNGKTYFKFVSSNLNMDPGLMVFNFENLFNGDKQLGDNINKVINDNWREIYEDVKEEYTELINRILLGLLENFFNKVSIEEAFD